MATKDPADDSKSKYITSRLFVDINTLLEKGVESQRIEFKAAWHVKKKDGTYWQVLRTISAFGNDYYNDNGGYIIIGVEEENPSTDAGVKRQAKFPLRGVEATDLDLMQKEIMGACKANIKPDFSPILSPEYVQEKWLLVIWVPAGDNRPYECRESEKGNMRYFIRKATQTVKATHEETGILHQNHSKIPFDDRLARNQDSGEVLNYQREIKLELVQSFLKEVHSKLSLTDSNRENVFQHLQLVGKNGDYQDENGNIRPLLVPRNVALLFFNREPKNHFRGAQIDIVHFDRNKRVIREEILSGPINKQIFQAIEYVLDFSREEGSVACVTYPQKALREAIVNAVYHRSYENDCPDPVKVHIRPDKIEVISYPGPHPSLKEEHFTAQVDMPPVVARNRRIGEFLRQFHLAEARGTGVSTIFSVMETNENPNPQFTFDNTYFQVVLPAHPRHTSNLLLRDVNDLHSKGETLKAIELMQAFLKKNPEMSSEIMILKLLELVKYDENHKAVQPYIWKLSENARKKAPLVVELKKWKKKEPLEVDVGVQIITKLVQHNASEDELQPGIEAAKLFHRELDPKSKKPELQNAQNAHRLYDALGKNICRGNGQIALGFARCKYNIFYMKSHQKSYREKMEFLIYLEESAELLHAALQLLGNDSNKYLATVNRQLAYVHFQLVLLKKSTKDEAQVYKKKALELDPQIKINRFSDPDALR